MSFVIWSLSVILSHPSSLLPKTPVTLVFCSLDGQSSSHIGSFVHALSSAWGTFSSPLTLEQNVLPKIPPSPWIPLLHHSLPYSLWIRSWALVVNYLRLLRKENNLLLLCGTWHIGNEPPWRRGTDNGTTYPKWATWQWRIKDVLTTDQWYFKGKILTKGRQCQKTNKQTNQKTEPL